MFILLASSPQASGCKDMTAIRVYGRELLQTVLKTCLNSSTKRNSCLLSSTGSCEHHSNVFVSFVSL